MKHRFTYFSEHALKRLNERTKLTTESVSDIIDMGLAIDIGTEPVFKRKHWLFYSKLDVNFFIAIQDEYTGYVITVLPVEYHEKLAWNIDKKYFTEAKYNIEEKNIQVMLKEFRELNSEPAKNILVKVRYLDSSNAVKTKSLFKLPAIDFNYSLEDVPIDKTFNNSIKQHLEAAGISSQSIFEVLLSYKREKKPRIVAWNAPVTKSV